MKAALASESPLNPNELRSAGDHIAGQLPKRKPKKQAFRWALATSLCLAGLLAWDWHQALGLVEELKGADNDGGFAYVGVPVPAGCYVIFITRMQQQPGANSGFAETREQLNQRVQTSQADGKARLLSELAVVDALLGKKHDATAEGRHAVDMLPISKDGVDGPNVLTNLAIVYAWSR